MARSIFVLAVGFILAISGCQPPGSDIHVRTRFNYSFPAQMTDSALQGRLLLLIARDSTTEPRFQINDGVESAQVFGMNIEGWSTREVRVFKEKSFGYPVQKLVDLPPGQYWIQGLLHQYETFQLATGHTVKLPMDRGEGQQWNQAPGNLYSTPQKLYINPHEEHEVRIVLDQVIPPIDSPADTRYVKHIKMRSERLSEFWGRDIYLGAHVLLPEGFDEHPEVRYPLAIFHGHYPRDFSGWRTTAPDDTDPCEYSARFGVDCYNHIQDSMAYELYKAWTGPGFPRVLAIKIQHPTPYYDDSYAVNSASQGPWGDALTYELIPFIEEKFRGIGEGWARFVYGGSTGGWEALAVQVKYPDQYNGCFAACPDPIDFRAYGLINLYEDKNAYQLEGPFQAIERPGHRDSLGRVSSTLRHMNYRELALADKGRSGQQWDIWQATYSPQGEDGYPKPIWDKFSGDIDPDVAEYWRENYDLVHIMRRDWATLGPKLRGKIRIYCGDMDNYYLNNAVYLAEDFLESTTSPYYAGEVDYGDRAEHCWNGDQTRPNHISRLRYHQMFIPAWAEWVQTHAPEGADLRSWRY